MNIFLLILSFRILNCSLNPNDYQMIITYGKPLNDSDSTLADSFEDCVEYCWRNNSCVFVYESPPICKVYWITNVANVQKLNASSQNRIAFRTYSPANTCPDISTAPILLGVAVTGRSYYKIGGVLNVYREFNFSLNLKNNIWTFKLASFYPCGYGYPIKRGSTVYCIGALGNDGRCMNKSVVLAEMAPGWTLMGIADIWEYEYFEKFATGYLPYNNYTKLGFWMDGIRKSSCKFPVTPSVACNGTNEFTYSDKTAPNPQFEWLPGQPDGIQNEPPDSNCLYLRVSSDGENGVDDMPCSYSNVSSLDLCFNGYIAGSPAVPN